MSSISDDAAPVNPDAPAYRPHDEDWREYAEWCDRLDHPRRLTLPELADSEVDAYRRWGTEVGNLFAAHMELLALMIRATGAETVSTFQDRHDCMMDFKAWQEGR